MAVPKSALKPVPRKCPVCEKRFENKASLIAHIDRSHAESIPPNWSAAQYENYTRTGQTHGVCTECKKETTWNESTWKYNRLCDSPKCREAISKRANKNMISKYGKVHLLNDPEMQRKMIYSKRTSGKYFWSTDTNKKQPFYYASQMELSFLEMLDVFLNMDPSDVLSPSPHNYTYKYDGKDHIYIPDVYIVSLNLEVEIKEPKDNQNKHPKIQAVDKVKERLKDDVMNSIDEVNYIKINGTDYSEFFTLLNRLKDEDVCIKRNSSKVYQLCEIVSTVSQTHHNKERKNLSTFKAVPITTSLINKLSTAYPSVKHIRINKNTDGLCYFDNNKLVGYVNVEAKDNGIWINALEIIKDYRGYDLSPQLLKVAETKLGANKLSVNKKNEIALALYKKNGWEQYDETSSMIFMSKPTSSLMEQVIRSKSTLTNISNVLLSINSSIIDTLDLNPKFMDTDATVKRITKMINDCASLSDCDRVTAYIQATKDILNKELKDREPKRSRDSENEYEIKKALKLIDTKLEPALEKKYKSIVRSSFVTEEIDYDNLCLVEESTDITAEKNNVKYKPIFVFLSKNGSPLSKLIVKYTQQNFSHASISLNTKLQNMYSFGPSQDDTLRLGFVDNEDILNYKRNPTGTYALYMYIAPMDQYEAMKEAINKFKENMDNLHYSVKGLFNIMMGRPSEYENAYFCSEFVSTILSTGNPKLIKKHASLYTPGDLANTRKMIKVSSGKFVDYDEQKVDRIVKRLLRERGFINVNLEY